MANDGHPAAIRYQGVMVSSTFTDLIQHRAALIQAIDGQDLKPVVMENDSAKARCRRPGLLPRDGAEDATAEAQLALARFHLGQLSDPRHEAERLANAKKPFHRTIAALWLAIGDRERTKEHALAAYKGAWADGEPYVHRYALNKARALLEEIRRGDPRASALRPVQGRKAPLGGRGGRRHREAAG